MSIRNNKKLEAKKNSWNLISKKILFWKRAYLCHYVANIISYLYSYSVSCRCCLNKTFESYSHLDWLYLFSDCLQESFQLLQYQLNNFKDYWTCIAAIINRNYNSTRFFEMERRRITIIRIRTIYMSYNHHAGVQWNCSITTA